MPDDGVGFGNVVACQKESIPTRIKTIVQKAISGDIAFSQFTSLQGPHVLSLPALGTLGHVELDRLAFLEAPEPACLDGREVHKNIFATLPADEAVALGIVEPLYRSLFCHIDNGIPFN
jgi:hypothetical protein